MQYDARGRLILSGTENGIFRPSNRNSDAAMTLRLGRPTVRHKDSLPLRRCDSWAGTRTRTPANNRVDIPTKSVNGRNRLQSEQPFVHAQLMATCWRSSQVLPAESLISSKPDQWREPGPLVCTVNAPAACRLGCFPVGQAARRRLAADWFPQRPRRECLSRSTGNHNADYLLRDDPTLICHAAITKRPIESDDWDQLLNGRSARYRSNPDSIEFCNARDR